LTDSLNTNWVNSIDFPLLGAPVITHNCPRRKPATSWSSDERLDDHVSPS